VVFAAATELTTDALVDRVQEWAVNGYRIRTHGRKPRTDPGRNRPDSFRSVRAALALRRTRRALSIQTNQFRIKVGRLRKNRALAHARIY
jgi:hypothetical protein